MASLLLSFQLKTALVLALFAVALLADDARAQGKSKAEIVPQIPHSNWVNSVALSPDGVRVLSASSESTLKLWHTGTGRLIRTFEGHSGFVHSVAFSPDGARVISGSDDNTLKLWNATTGQILRTLEDTQAVFSVAFSPDGDHVISGGGSHKGKDNALKLWDLATGALLRTFEGHSAAVTLVAFSSDGGRVLSGSVDGVKLWNATTGDLLRTLVMPWGPATLIAFSGDGDRVVSVSRDNKVELAIGDRVESISLDDSLKLWEATTGELLRTFEGHSHSINFVAFSHDGMKIVSASRGLPILEIRSLSQGTRRSLGALHQINLQRTMPRASSW